MKKSLLMLFLLIATSVIVQAAPCGVGTLATYDAPGYSCTIDGLTFSNFSYTTSESGGASTPDAGGVTVIPQTTGEVGFLFQAFWAAGLSQTEDSLINYTAACTSGTDCISDLSLQMVGGALLTGSASIVETTSNGLSLTTFAEGGTSLLNDSTTFSPVESLNLQKDIGVGGGTTGFGHISGAYNLFSTVPEPALTALCAGMLFLIPVARRKFGRKASGM